MARVSEEDIRDLANKYGLPPEIALAIYGQESSSGSNVKDSPKGAKGGFQVMPATFKSLGGTDINDPMQNAEAGIKYLAEGYKKSKSVEGTAAYYHAGPDWQRKLQENPNLSDAAPGYTGIRTVDYAKAVAAKVAKLKGDTGMGDEAGTSVTPNVSNAPNTSNVEPALGPTVVTAQRKDYFHDFFNEGGKLIEDMILSTNEMMKSSVDMRDKTKENLADQAESLRKQGELSATIGMEDYRLKAQKAGENAAELSRLGINTSDTDALIAKISTGLVKDYTTAAQMRAEITRKQNVQIIDNPLEYIVNQLTLNQDIRAHNQVVEKIAADKHFVDQTTTVAANVSAVNSAKYAPTTVQGASAAAELERERANAAVIKLDDAKMKVDFDYQIRTLRVLEAQANMLRNLETAEELRVIKRTDAERKQKAEEVAIIDDKRAVAAAAVLGMKVSGMKDLQKMPKDVKDAIEHVMVSDHGKIAKSPLEAEEILARGNLVANERGPGMSPATAQMARMLKGYRVEAEKLVQANKTITTQEGQKAAINNYMAQQLNDAMRTPGKDLSIIVAGKQTNPFKAPDVDIMSQPGGAPDLKLTKILAAHEKSLPNVPVTDSLVPNLAYAMVGKEGGYKDIGEAAKDIANYYQAAIARNNNIYHPEQYGLITQNSYFVNGANLASVPGATKVMLDLKARTFTHADWGVMMTGGEPLIPNKLKAAGAK